MEGGSRKKKVLYVGGLDNLVTEDVLFAAFIPFGSAIVINTVFKINLTLLSF